MIFDINVLQDEICPAKENSIDKPICEIDESYTNLGMMTNIWTGYLSKYSSDFKSPEYISEMENVISPDDFDMSVVLVFQYLLSVNIMISKLGKFINHVVYYEYNRNGDIYEYKFEDKYYYIRSKYNMAIALNLAEFDDEELVERIYPPKKILGDITSEDLRLLDNYILNNYLDYVHDGTTIQDEFKSLRTTIKLLANMMKDFKMDLPNTNEIFVYSGSKSPELYKRFLKESMSYSVVRGVFITLVEDEYSQPYFYYHDLKRLSYNRRASVFLSMDGKLVTKLYYDTKEKLRSIVVSNDNSDILIEFAIFQFLNNRYKNLIHYYPNSLNFSPLHRTIAMDYGGVTLDRYFEENPNLSVYDLKVIIYQILLGLESLRVNSLIHRDLKHTNIVINPSTGVVKLIDFGLACYMGLNCVETEYIQTPYTRSPEVNSKLDISNSMRMDVWSLGMIIYTYISGDMTTYVITKRYDSYDTRSNLLRMLYYSILTKAEPRPLIDSFYAIFNNERLEDDDAIGTSFEGLKLSGRNIIQLIKNNITSEGTLERNVKPEYKTKEILELVNSMLRFLYTRRPDTNRIIYGYSQFSEIAKEKTSDGKIKYRRPKSPKSNVKNLEIRLSKEDKKVIKAFYDVYEFDPLIMKNAIRMFTEYKNKVVIDGIRTKTNIFKVCIYINEMIYGSNIVNTVPDDYETVMYDMLVDKDVKIIQHDQFIDHDQITMRAKVYDYIKELLR